jgi:hypothetical protein
MESAEIVYKVIFHTKGYIRLEVPSLRKLSWSYLYANFKKSPPFPLPSGIKDFHVNPFKGNIVIRYEPENIDILHFIKNMASDPDVRNIIRG